MNDFNRAHLSNTFDAFLVTKDWRPSVLSMWYSFFLTNHAHFLTKTRLNMLFTPMMPGKAKIRLILQCYTAWGKIFKICKASFLSGPNAEQYWIMLMLSKALPSIAKHCWALLCIEEHYWTLLKIAEGTIDLCWPLIRRNRQTTRNGWQTKKQTITGS